ncbi:MAG: alpha/beta hydrolase [Nonlabens sp.]
MNNSLTYYSTGNSTPSHLFIHGFLGSSNQWETLMNSCFKNTPTLSVDLYGHGNSKDLADYSIEDVATAINQLLLELGINNIHLIGHSMGGYVGSAFAKAYPKQTASLTLINSNTAADSLDRLHSRNRSIQLVDAHKNAFVGMAISNLFQNQEREAHGNAIELMKFQAKNISVSSVKAAILAMRDRPSCTSEMLDRNFTIHYIAGERDEIIPLELIQKESIHLGARLTVIESGHMSIITDADALCTALSTGIRIQN